MTQEELLAFSRALLAENTDLRMRLAEAARKIEALEKAVNQRSRGTE
ncbi:hypothetical protein UFOVP820_32 [uncultured Caudovirales phage]|uniref:Uncharacterized protein n=1 Tax=uncultured Caudovirales phage TaxID=2100421 RepID=A0A6J5P7B4_9CAUD|nr:hypothetical protein UFOVP820_32 [uncultured Caudovirales phage]